MPVSPDTLRHTVSINENFAVGSLPQGEQGALRASPRGLLRGRWPLALRAGRLCRSSELAPLALGSNQRRWEVRIRVEAGLLG